MQISEWDWRRLLTALRGEQRLNAVAQRPQRGNGLWARQYSERACNVRPLDMRPELAFRAS